MNKKRFEDNASTRIINDLQGLIDDKEKLERENEEIKEKHIDISRFNNRPLSVSAVAALHKKTVKTVRKYITYGLISKHPNSTDDMIFVPAHEALTLDFKQLMRAAKVRAVAYK